MNRNAVYGPNKNKPPQKEISEDALMKAAQPTNMELGNIKMKLIQVQYIPNVENMEPGILYYSPEYKCTNHLCPCGCGTQVPLRVNVGEDIKDKMIWGIIINEERVSLAPSIYNRNCTAHYHIKA